MCLLLINKGANVNAVDNIKDTPLTWAAYRGLASVVSLLLSKGADVQHRNQAGKTALDKASTDAVRKILREHNPEVRVCIGKWDEARGNWVDITT